MTGYEPNPGNKSSVSKVAERRRALKFSQEELARRAGVSRTLLSSLETGRATPSVKAALAIANALGTTVEFLFDESFVGNPPAGWAWPPPGPVSRYWEVREMDGALRYPAAVSASSPFPHDGVADGARLIVRCANPPPTLVMASCDPAASLLAAEYARITGIRLLVFPSNSGASLNLLARGAVHLGALHCGSSDEEDENLRRVRETLGSGWVLLRAARWESGLAHAEPLISPQPKTLAKCRWAMREAGAIARETMDRLLDHRSISGREVRGHREVADAIRSGWAEVGICIRLCAEENQLCFSIQQKETLDLVFAEHWLEDRRFRSLIDLIQSRSYRKIVTDLPGYSARETGSLTYA